MEEQKFQKVTRTDLVRDSGEIFDNVLRGRAALVEKHGKPQAVLMDIYDYYGLRAAALSREEKEEDIAELEKFVIETDDDERVHVKIIGQYLAEGITLEKAAELLGVAGVDLKVRFMRLGIPIRGEGGNG